MDFTFFNWEYLATFAGCMVAVGILTELLKNVGFIAKIPTQLFSWVMAFVILILAQLFTGNLTVDSAVISILNAAVISLATNGGYEAIVNLVKGKE